MDLPSFNVLSICSGIAGLDIGIKLAVGNARTVCYVEREAYPIATLVSRMQEASLDEAPIWTDLASFDGKPWRGVVDCVSGGYPCQPFSMAGDRRGVEDPRHIWPHISRIIGEIQPEWCFFENVRGHLTLGFQEVWGDLRGLGYEVEAGLFSAKEVGAPHLRERLYILAHTDDNESQRQGRLGALGGTTSTYAGEAPQRKRHRDAAGRGGETMADTQLQGLEGSAGEGLQGARRPSIIPTRSRGGSVSESRLGGNFDGLSSWLDLDWPSRPTEPQRDWEPPRVGTDIPDRARRLTALGNSVVPQTAALALTTLLSRFAAQ